MKLKHYSIFMIVGFEKNLKMITLNLFLQKNMLIEYIGLMLNMDWFQPFINSQYSVGIIYAVICNLLCAECFKPKNILTLVVIPGLNELKLHKINNYLFPIAKLCDHPVIFKNLFIWLLKIKSEIITNNKITQLNIFILYYL